MIASIEPYALDMGDGLVEVEHRRQERHVEDGKGLVMYPYGNGIGNDLYAELELQAIEEDLK